MRRLRWVQSLSLSFTFTVTFTFHGIGFVVCDRKLQKAEGQRRSPRISALEAEAEAHSLSMSRHLDNSEGPAFRTRGRKNTKLMPLQQPNKGVKHSSREDIQKKSADDRPSKLPSSTFLPEKRILQLVLDTLQRRDTYEIFAEPVDPNEVEDYYSIIKEPMDFGTMRAKLHEGMYTSLEQFEVTAFILFYLYHDVFLIFDNAMHFNSSGTIYFRQARVINELAKKVFDLLKNNIEKFELEFSETRRKVGRRNPGDFRDSIDMNSCEIDTGVPSKTVPCSSRGTSNRKSIRANHGCPDIAKHVDARDVEIPSGTKDSSRCRSFEVDRRCTYRPLSLDEDKSIFSTVYGKLKLLEQVNQQDIGYKDSLMLFVKDLGTTAKNIAKRKLLGCEIRTASTSVPCTPNTSNYTVTASALMSQYPLNRFPDYPNEMRSPMEKIASRREGVEGTLNTERESRCNPLEGNTQGSHGWPLGCDREFPNQSFCFDSHCSRACAEDFKETGKKMLLDKSKFVNQEQLTVSIQENSQTNLLESKMESKCKFQPRPWAMESSNVSCFAQDRSQMHQSSSKCVLGDRLAQCPTKEFSWSSESMKILKSDQCVPLASSFVFNLPYLRTRLDQINSSEQYGFLQP
ncbi:bromodomain-containing protein DDB_G0270170-like [Abrus precatorius]|uniref:Bromodomain-containing protein DDB_G0270170-like n=1 Tax=Abrus precatorius TaxID=3816 RepID=A0A8B8K0K1_ABRPR|nr:bromodomain-containing protein DDB_G0270170-like [Abrus precatorius]